jgi:NTE family protein
VRGRWPASPAYLRAVLARPWRLRIGPLLAALLPEGTHGNESIGEAFARLYEAEWPRRPLWIPAVHADTGTRIVFGRAGAPSVDVGTAVRCSSAVPGLRRPVCVAANWYIDGGILSPVHVDLIADSRVEPLGARRVAIISSPLSRFTLMRRLLRAELRPLYRRGIDVVLFEPDGEVAAAMGWNPMSVEVAPRVADAAYRSTVRRLMRPESSAMLQLLAAHGKVALQG